MWRIFFIEGYSTLEDVQKAYSHYSENIPLIAPVLKYENHDPMGTYWANKWMVDAIRKNLPAGDHPELPVLYTAARLHIELHSNARKGAGILYSPIGIDQHNIGNVLFIANNLAAVQKFKPVFLDQGLWSEYQIAPVLEAGTLALAGGVL